MSYTRPPVLTAGDIVKGTHFTTIRDDWVKYEAHPHTGDGTDGADVLVVLLNGA